MRTPGPVEGSRTDAACGVHVWATAHGIDLSYSSPLVRCDCAAHRPAPPVDAARLRAKVAEANRISSWGRPY
ncbi:hypothetical protein [Streptomyces sp. NPDC002537]